MNAHLVPSLQMSANIPKWLWWAWDVTSLISDHTCINSFLGLFQWRWLWYWCRQQVFVWYSSALEISKHARLLGSVRPKKTHVSDGAGQSLGFRTWILRHLQLEELDERWRVIITTLRFFRRTKQAMRGASERVKTRGLKSWQSHTGWKNAKACCMYVCMYLFTYIGMYVYVCMGVCMYVCMHTYMHTYIHACMCVCMYACICMYTHVQTPKARRSDSRTPAERMALRKVMGRSSLSEERASSPHCMWSLCRLSWCLKWIKATCTNARCKLCVLCRMIVGRLADRGQESKCLCVCVTREKRQESSGRGGTQIVPGFLLTVWE